jgi:hypothetical protein
MDNNHTDQLLRDLEVSPGLIAGVVSILIAIYIFSPGGRAKIKHRVAQLVLALFFIGGVAAAWSYVTTYAA